MNEANPIRGAGHPAEGRGTLPVMEQRVTPSAQQAWDKFGVWRERERLSTFVKDPTIDVIILAAGTGTGKTRFGTQIALEALGGSSKMIVTENLRRATVASAEMVAKDMGVKYGQEVGATNRYQHDATKDTRLLFCPVQSLLIRLEKDPNLEGINMVAMDEVHKESKANEMCMVALRDLQIKRKAAGKPPLKLMFISATLDQEKIKRSFPGAKVEPLVIPGDNQPITDVWEASGKPFPAYNDLPKLAAEKAAQSLSKDKGNILVFMSGKKEIDDAMVAFRAKSEEQKVDLKNVELVPYYGTLPPEEQKKLFEEKNGKRIVVFATNAAQESLTLDTHVVIDTTVHKHMDVDTATGRQYLKQVFAPKSHLLQRKGRVGRIPLTEEQKQQGYEYKYYALCSKEEWENRAAHESAEMQRTDLIHDALLMYADGYDPYKFNYINKPDASHIKPAVSRLEKLGALNKGALTEKGAFMASLSLKPNLSSMMHASIQHGCARQAGAIAAILEEYPMAFAEGNEKLNQFKNPQSDLLGYLDLFNHFHTLDKGQRRQWATSVGLQYQKMKDADDLYGQLIRQVQEYNPKVDLETQPNSGSLDRAIYQGFADSLLMRKIDGMYEMEGVGIKIGRESVLNNKGQGKIAAIDIRPIVKYDKIFDRLATLNHPIPDAVWDEMHPKKPVSPSTDNRPAASAGPISTDSTVPPQAKPEPAPQETPPPPPQTIMQRFKSWVSNSWFGKLWKRMFP